MSYLAHPLKVLIKSVSALLVYTEDCLDYKTKLVGRNWNSSENVQIYIFSTSDDLCRLKLPSVSYLAHPLKVLIKSVAPFCLAANRIQKTSHHRKKHD